MSKYRTHYAGKISEEEIGKQVITCGWVENIRDHGGIEFVDLRDQYGVIQLVSDNNTIFNNLTKESAITIDGIVRKRDEEDYNDRIFSGTIEI